MSNEENFENLTFAQRLKAAVHHTTLKICKEDCEEKNVKLNRMVVAAISETTWKKCEQFATDLESFAKLEYINGIQEEMSASKAETKKKTKKTKGKETASTSSAHAVEDIDENSMT